MPASKALEYAFGDLKVSPIKAIVSFLELSTPKLSIHLPCSPKLA